ncbi:MAG: hypothetical protein QM658_15275 [Gordonia sp. (in: high G+C Gram-positive bacteria)]
MPEMRSCAALLTIAGVVGAGVAVTPAIAAAQPRPHCVPASVSRHLPASTPIRDWSENLTRDTDGNLWVSRVQAGRIDRYNSKDHRTGSVAVESPGAVRLGPDGLMYAVYGDTFSPGAPGGVVRFDPAARRPVATPFASGLQFPNGSEFGPDGELYVATSKGVVRVRTDGTVDRSWSSRNSINANGLLVRGRTAFVTSNSPSLGRVIALPLDRPEGPRTVTTIPSSAGIGPDFADDLTAGPDGALLVTTLGGQLVRVTASQTCTVTRTQPLTSLAESGQPDVYFAGTESGDVLRIKVR